METKPHEDVCLSCYKKHGRMKDVLFESLEEMFKFHRSFNMCQCFPIENILKDRSYISRFDTVPELCPYQLEHLYLDKDQE